MKLITGILLLVVIAVSSARAQTPYFQGYTLLRKNEPVVVNKIFQDDKGFMWYATTRGLFRFDGIDFRRFTLKDSLLNENVTALAQDSLGRIWIGYVNGGISFMENNSVLKFTPPEGLGQKEVSDILFDKEGRLWFSTLDDGLYYFVNDRLYRLDETNGMPDLFVYDIEEDEKGRIWAGTDRGLISCSVKGNNVALEVFDSKQGLPDDIVKKIRIGDDHAIWCATEDAGIVRYDASSKKFDLLISDWKYGTVTDFILDEDKVWISGFSEGLILVNKKTKKSSVYNDNILRAQFSSITSLQKDNEGNVWMGSKSGVVRSYGNYVQFLDGLSPASDLNVVALASDPMDNLWFSTSEGLYKRKMTNGKSVIERQLVNTPFQNRSVISLYTDSQGYVWAGLYGEGVLRIHPTTGKITYLNKELRNGNVLNISGKEKVVWLATLGGAVKITLNEKLEIKNYGSDNGLSSDYIYQVLVDSWNRVWFATDGKGVDMLDEKGFHHYKEGFNSKVIYSITEDGNHQLWANAQGDGLYKLENEVFRPFASVHLGDNNISCLFTDPSGGLVVTHDLGIDLITKQNYQIRSLGESVGLRDHKANLNCVTNDQNGNILIGTDKGIIFLQSLPQSLISSPIPRVTSVKVFDKHLPLSSDYQFDYDENNVTIDYIGLWYQNPKDLFFRYKMENYDRDWMNTRQRSVVYSSLPPGNYKFSVMVSSSDDFSKSEERTITIIVKYPFWRTWPFYFLAVVLLAFSGFSVLKFRERNLKRYNHLLEEKVRVRTEEISKKNEEIMAQTEEIKSMNDNLEELVEERTSELERKNKALEHYAFITAHNLRAPVASILGLINLMAKLNLPQEDRDMLNHLQDSADRLNEIVRSMTEAIEKGDS
jgi:ligand-binding sensor domain-containing protein